MARVKVVKAGASVFQDAYDSADFLGGVRKKKKNRVEGGGNWPP